MFQIHPKPRRIDEIFWETNFLSSSEILKIENQINSINYQRGLAGNPKEDYGKLVRSSNIKWIPQHNNWKWLYDKIIVKILETNEDYWEFNLNSMYDPIQYSTYLSTEDGKYDWHLDIGPDVASYRKLSAVIPLTPSNLYEGGNLEFLANQRIEEKQLEDLNKAGSIVLFPSYILHRVTPVTKGSRNSLVIWMGGVPFR